MCSLIEAFQTISDPISRNDDLFGNVQASNDVDISEKKKKKKRRVPMPPLEQVIEPDRPAHRTLPPAELLGAGPTSNTRDSSMSDMLSALDSAEYFPHPSTDVPNQNAYTLEPNWATAFNDTSAPSWIKERMPKRDNQAPLVVAPWMDGAPTLWKKVPEGQNEQLDLDAVERKVDSTLSAYQTKFEAMFKKLEELESSRSESQHLEIILFVLGGIFILLILDILVKQGTQAMVLLGNATATVGGGRYFMN